MTTQIPGYYLLNAEQIQNYYVHINLPQQYRHDPASGAARDPGRALSWQSAIIRHHAAAVPFENLTLHYDRSHVVTLAHDVVYEKVMKTYNGRACNRGNYCLENGGFLLCVLRSLGFDVYSTGGCINRQYSDSHAQKQFESWGHLINLVRIGGKTYVADIGMSLGMPVFAVPLEEATLHNHGTFSMRLSRGPISETTSPGQ